MRYCNIWQREQNEESMRARDSWPGLPIEKTIQSPQGSSYPQEMTKSTS